MKKIACRLLAGLTILLWHVVAPAAGDVYYPYQTYDAYHRKHTSPQPPPVPPAPPQPLPEPKAPPRPEQPINLRQPPEFLFPKELGFGVAVGIPYDLFYLADSYYLLKTGTWYRAPSYRGPWRLQGLSRVPPVLRQYSIAQIRKIRNREFAAFWNNRENYKGRYFRPDGEAPAVPSKKGP